MVQQPKGQKPHLRPINQGAVALCGVTGQPVAWKSAIDRTTSHLTKLQKPQQVIGYITEE